MEQTNWLSSLVMSSSQLTQMQLLILITFFIYRLTFLCNCRSYSSKSNTFLLKYYTLYYYFNLQHTGKKELILANRSELELGHFLREGSFSKVDVDSVDLDSYPGFSEITFYNATIEAGDCVYIPTFWGHVVRSWGRLGDITFVLSGTCLLQIFHSCL